MCILCVWPSNNIVWMLGVEIASRWQILFTTEEEEEEGEP